MNNKDIAEKPKHDQRARAMRLLIEKTAHEHPEFRKIVDKKVEEILAKRSRPKNL